MVNSVSVQDEKVSSFSLQKDLYCTEATINLTKQDVLKISAYDLQKYKLDIERFGLAKTWEILCEYLKQYGENMDFFKIANFGEMYEIGLAIEDKNNKKQRGQYYTPDDVATVMSRFLFDSHGANICDVGCGTGNLVLAYLDCLGKEDAVKLIQEGRLYLYDNDKVALNICKTAIMVKYGVKDADAINIVMCDFLDSTVSLPQNCKVICNPPYSKIKNIKDNWNVTDVIISTKDLYAAFMDKIFTQSVSAVIISPFSFVSGSKFYTLREKMCQIGHGMIFSFDNVPGNIFKGKKHGVFNSNTVNSVRAAITVFNKDLQVRGFQVAPLIRFKNEERALILNPDTLKQTLPDDYQIISINNQSFAKINKNLIQLYNAWVDNSSYILGEIIDKPEDFRMLYVPNTCRYFTTGSATELDRKGVIALKIPQYYYSVIYCLINSSFAYWWWRIFDGGITYSVNLLRRLPLPLNLLKDDDMVFFVKQCKRMIASEKEHIKTKKNAGKNQENIKFPTKMRTEINRRILKILDCQLDIKVLNKIHNNSYGDEGGV